MLSHTSSPLDRRIASTDPASAIRLLTLVLALVSLWLLPVRPALAQGPTYEELKEQAEQFYAEKSYARAYDLYEQAQKAEAPESEARWIRFRLADTLWRKSPKDAPDDAAMNTARKNLNALIQEYERPEDRDRTFAEANESMGDSMIYGSRRANAGGAWQYYSVAAQWWAQSSDIDVARDRYLSLVWRTLDAEAGDWRWRGQSGVVPLEVVRNVLEIATTDEDRCRAHFEIAMKLRYAAGNNPRTIQDVTKHFDAALASKDRGSRYVDALMAYAQWMQSYGKVNVLENGQWQWKPDYVRAAELYKRLLDEFKPEEIDRREVVRQYYSIMLPSLSVVASQAFLPNSEIAFDAHWRNIKQIDFTLYRVNLLEQTALRGPVKRDEVQKDDRRAYTGSADSWIRHVDLSNAEVARTWSRETGDSGEHIPMSDQIQLDEPLPIGAYVLVARGGDVEAYELLIVTDLAVVAKRRGKEVLLYACDALTGAPVPDVKFRAWDTTVDTNNEIQKWIGREYDADADEQGIAHLDVKAGNEGSENNSLLIFASDGKRQTMLTSYRGYWYSSRETVGIWRIYANTDRPAYRPGDTAQYRFVARVWDKEGWTNPSGRALHYQILDSRGTKVDEQDLTLSEYGSGFGSIELKPEWPLGEYTIQFTATSGAAKQIVASATLFRLEEYKLPEFTVTVEPRKDENGKPILYRIGDVVQADIVAEYYFGGPVASADVEVVVNQKPFYHWYQRPRSYPWYYDDSNSRNYYGWYGGETVKRETIKTDADGHATVSFETPFSSDQDYEYTIEARVTDSSRREITGSGNVRVTRQGHFVYPEVAHKIYQPGEKVETNIKAFDANSTPIEVEGTVTVTRQWWDEVWVDPAGREVQLGQVSEIRQKLGVFPPPPRPDDRHPWRASFRGYRSEKVMTEKVRTNAQGEATFVFTPQREGYYVIDWVSPDPPLAPVTAQTAAWITTNQTSDLGYRSEGVDIIVDKDTFETGTAAPIMISTSSSNRYVLFTVEGEELYHWQLVHVTGSIKLMNIDVRDAYVPNVTLAATMVSGAEMMTADQEIVVPPTRHFVDVTVTPDQELYEPGAEGALTVKTVDHEGKPISAEVAVSVFDESVLYIQSDYAGDPRQFFYNQKQYNRVSTGGSLSDRALLRLVKTKSGRYEDARYATVEEDKADGDRPAGEAAAFGGGGSSGSGNMFSQDNFEGVSRMRLASRGEAMKDAGMAKSEAQFAPASAAAPPPPPGEEPQPEIKVRTDFRATAFWDASVITGADGTASVKVPYPETLTRWKAIARANTTGADFGIGEATARTNKPVTVRIQGPRFFTVGDSIGLSYIVKNNTDEPIMQQPTVDLSGVRYGGILVSNGTYQRRLSPAPGRVVPAHGEERYDLLFFSDVPGTAELSVKIQVEKSDLSDAVRMTWPVYDHGIDKFLAVSGKARGDQAIVSLDLPEQRRAGTTRMSVTVTPSMAVTMLDALPYLLDYPYGCVEQTMSRFLPAVIVNRTLSNLGLAPEDVADRTFGGIEMVNGHPAHPRGNKDQNLEHLDDIVAQGLKRLGDMQHGDGGWGWWKDGDSDRYMTAYVVWGLGLAREAQLDVAGEMITRGADYLVNTLSTARDQPELQAWMLQALASSRATSMPVESHKAVGVAYNNLWAKRDQLSDTGRALLALSAHYLGKKDQAQTLVRNLENGVIRDDRPDQSILVRNTDGSAPTVLGTAHWGASGGYRYWYNGGIESTTLCLRALLAIDPKNALVEPATNWLVRNRRGAQWTNTRDTSMAVLTLCDYLRASGELSATGRFEVMANGRLIGTGEVTRDNILSAPTTFDVPDASTRNGANEIRIRRLSGDAALYFAAQATFFTLEEPITEAGNEIFVRRDYYRLVPMPTLLSGVVYARIPLKDEDKVTSGDRIEVVLTVEAKNDYEYLVFEDLKPAGLEATQLRSGEPMYIYELKRSAAERKYDEGEVKEQDGRRRFAPGSITGDQSNLTGRSRWIHQELRDRKVAFFVDQLPEGVWQIRYEARAETPGRFHALPLMGHAMYVPEVRANSEELRVNVEDRR